MKKLIRKWMILGVVAASFFPLTSFAYIQEDFCCKKNIMGAGLWCVVTQAGANMMNNYYNTNQFYIGSPAFGAHCNTGDNWCDSTLPEHQVCFN